MCAETQKMATETRLVNEQIRGSAAGQQSNHVASAVAVTGHQE
jgi:hypothetical protein